MRCFQGEFPNIKKLPDVSPKEASVLVPLCNFNNKFSILYALQPASDAPLSDKLPVIRCAL
jgi:hypothetical protein